MSEAQSQEMTIAELVNDFPARMLCPECDGVAFFYRTVPLRGQQFDNYDARYADGSIPISIEPKVKCGNCGEEVSARTLTWRGKTWSE